MKTKLLPLTSVLSSALILGVVTYAGQQSAGGLTAYALDSLIQSIEDAWEDGDIEGILELLAPDFSITLDLEKQGRRFVVQYNRDEYAKHLTDTFAAMSHYEGAQVFKKTDLLNGGRTALVTLHYRESMGLGEKTVKSFSQYSMVVNAHEERPLIVSAHGIVISVE